MGERNRKRRWKRKGRRKMRTTVIKTFPDFLDLIRVQLNFPCHINK
jgi:hypothetical protein